MALCKRPGRVSFEGIHIFFLSSIPVRASCSFNLKRKFQA
ncbi:Uncharacterised protein [Vibrio cholerae]|uniref:Uncharacterized protein n=1 Tax=Vibrio cholerae TaxID=666 RepID=A0A655Y933_VIBCL|nr:Uncharacterised protein [Vibrio cholerae]CSC33881.1 Uncharacterised protein [Vibrio cholerae]